MPLVKREIHRSPQDWVWDAPFFLNFPGMPLASLGAGVLTSVVQSVVLLPTACKISLVQVAAATLDTLAGTDTFNLVVGNGSSIAGGSQAYTASNVAPTDNSDAATLPAGGSGYSTAFATFGNAMFSTDQGLTVGAGVGVAASTLNPVLPTPTLAGGIWRFVPTVPDAIYPAGSILTFRAGTTAATGAVTGLSCILMVTPTMLRSQKYSADVVVSPGVEF